jgi:hypothetical protein
MVKEQLELYRAIISAHIQALQLAKIRGASNQREYDCVAQQVRHCCAPVAPPPDSPAADWKMNGCSLCPGSGSKLVPKTVEN